MTSSFRVTNICDDLQRTHLTVDLVCRVAGIVKAHCGLTCLGRACLFRASACTLVRCRSGTCSASSARRCASCRPALCVVCRTWVVSLNDPPFAGVTIAILTAVYGRCRLGSGDAVASVSVTRCSLARVTQGGALLWLCSRVDVAFAGAGVEGGDVALVGVGTGGAAVTLTGVSLKVSNFPRSFWEIPHLFLGRHHKSQTGC